ncbi:MAG: mechanosensitive ion channel [Nitrososphaerota archaeon]
MPLPTTMLQEVTSLAIILLVYILTLTVTRGLIGPLLDVVSCRVGGLFRLVVTAASLASFPVVAADLPQDSSSLYIVTATYLVVLAIMYRPLMEMFTGDILRLSGSIRVGDYIRLDGLMAKVVNLRTFNALLTTPQLQKILIPHSTLLTSRIVNLSQSGAGIVSLRIRVDGRKISIPDAKIVMLKTGTDIAKSELAPGRAAEVHVTDVDGDNVELQLTLYLSNPSKAESLAPVIMERIYAKLADVTQQAYI